MSYVFFLSDRKNSVFYIIWKENGIPKNLVINTVLLWLDSGASRILAIIMFTFFALYIMWAAMKGNLKVGIRLIFFKFYTLKYFSDKIP